MNRQFEVVDVLAKQDTLGPCDGSANEVKKQREVSEISFNYLRITFCIRKIKPLNQVAN